MNVNLPAMGESYFAPIALFSSVPLVFGERRGVVVDTPSQDAAVVYTSRAAAESALKDPAVWHPTNSSRARVAHLRYHGPLSGRACFDFTTEDERQAHASAIERANQ